MSILTAQLNRIEPPFWYAGMQNPELQILFYGGISLPTLLLLQMQFLSQTNRQKAKLHFRNCKH
jgi:hypothetical protein